MRDNRENRYDKYVVYATWMNDGTAKLNIECSLCDKWLDKDADEIEVRALSELIQFADEHEQKFHLRE